MFKKVSKTKEYDTWSTTLQSSESRKQNTQVISSREQSEGIIADSWDVMENYKGGMWVKSVPIKLTISMT